MVSCPPDCGCFRDRDEHVAQGPAPRGFPVELDLESFISLSPRINTYWGEGKSSGTDYIEV